jgi:hypothetical protein
MHRGRDRMRTHDFDGTSRVTRADWAALRERRGGGRRAPGTGERHGGADPSRRAPRRPCGRPLNTGRHRSTRRRTLEGMPPGLARTLRAVVPAAAVVGVAVTAHGGGAGSQHVTAAAPTAPRPYSLRRIERAFAEVGLPLHVSERFDGLVTLEVRAFAASADSLNAEDFTVTVSPRSPTPGEIVLTVVGSGYKTLTARNVSVEFVPTARSAVKVRAAVARLQHSG